MWKRVFGQEKITVGENERIALRSHYLECIAGIDVS
jgi:hypothetical protein